MHVLLPSKYAVSKQFTSENKSTVPIAARWYVFSPLYSCRIFVISYCVNCHLFTKPVIVVLSSVVSDCICLQLLVYSIVPSIPSSANLPFYTLLHFLIPHSFHQISVCPLILSHTHQSRTAY